MARYFLAENAENADFKSPAEIKEIKEMSPSENVVENLMRSQKFPLFPLFLRDIKFSARNAENN
jgi:hypothetical protein